MWIYDNLDEMCNLRYAKEIRRVVNPVTGYWYLRVTFSDNTYHVTQAFKNVKDCDKAFFKLAQSLKTKRLTEKHHA